MTNVTRDLLVNAGKEARVWAREANVIVKRKGELQTYWLVLGSQSASTTSGTDSNTEEEIDGPQKTGMLLRYATEKALTSSTCASFGRQNQATQRLILWNVDNLMVSIQKILAMRSEQKTLDKAAWKKLSLQITKGDTTAIDETRDIIDLKDLPEVTANAEAVMVDEVVVKQLVQLVSTISSMYNKNDFHNFDHASHVTQSVAKLLSRMVSPDVIDYEQMRYSRMIGGKGKHDFSRCIASDPLVQFAVVFGVPNAILVKESHEIDSGHNIFY